ncbi:MAG: TlpA family protein disulfide reductase [Candidatus Eremiobacteraeota bacterium]|nr:TlpA family protein disulfide reductase [Candidatus Eremiobacteraeota bacterium]
MRMLALALLTIVLLAQPAQARRAKAPSDATGLATIRYHAAPPDFTFPVGRGYSKISELAGKAVVLNFWATWCHACIDEMPYFERMKTQFGDRVAFITLSNETVGTARAYLADHHLDVPLLEDPHGVIFGEYSVQPIPVTIVVDTVGKVSYVCVGGLDWGELEGAVERALAPVSTSTQGR